MKSKKAIEKKVFIRFENEEEAQRLADFEAENKNEKKNSIRNRIFRAGMKQIIKEKRA